jgi:hypothetical protein
MKKYRLVYSIILISALIINLVPAGLYECPELSEESCSMEKMSCCTNPVQESTCCCLEKPAEKSKKETSNRAIPPAENTVKNILFFFSGMFQPANIATSTSYNVYTEKLLQTALTGNKVYITTQTFLI